MLLANHGVHIVRWQNNHIDRRGVVGHADGARLGAVLLVMKCDDGAEDTRENAMEHDRAVPVEEGANALVLDHADQGGWNEGVEAGEDEEDEPEWEEDAVSENEAEHPQEGDPEADVFVLLVGSREQIPDCEFFGGEALGYFVIDDCLKVHQKNGPIRNTEIVGNNCEMKGYQFDPISYQEYTQTIIKI